MKFVEATPTKKWHFRFWQDNRLCARDFAANYANARELNKKSAQIREIRG